MSRVGSWQNGLGLQSERLFNFDPTTNSLQLDLGSIFTFFFILGGRMAGLVEVAAMRRAPLIKFLSRGGWVSDCVGVRGGAPEAVPPREHQSEPEDVNCLPSASRGRG